MSHLQETSHEARDFCFSQNSCSTYILSLLQNPLQKKGLVVRGNPYQGWRGKQFDSLVLFDPLPQSYLFFMLFILGPTEIIKNMQR